MRPNVDLNTKTCLVKRPQVTTSSPGIDINKAARGFMVNKKTECQDDKRFVILIKHNAMTRLSGQKLL